MNPPSLAGYKGALVERARIRFLASELKAHFVAYEHASPELRRFLDARIQEAMLFIAAATRVHREAIGHAPSPVGTAVGSWEEGKAPRTSLDLKDALDKIIHAEKFVIDPASANRPVNELPDQQAGPRRTTETTVTSLAAPYRSGFVLAVGSQKGSSWRVRIEVSRLCDAVCALLPGD